MKKQKTNLEQLIDIQSSLTKALKKTGALVSKQSSIITNENGKEIRFVIENDKLVEIIKNQKDILF